MKLSVGGCGEVWGGRSPRGDHRPNDKHLSDGRSGLQIERFAITINIWTIIEEWNLIGYYAILMSICPYVIFRDKTS